MTVLYKHLDLKTLDNEIKEVKPDYISVGNEAFTILKTLSMDYSSFGNGVEGTFKGIPIYISKYLPSDKIILAKE